MRKYILAVILLAAVVSGVTPAAPSVMEDETDVQATVQPYASVELGGEIIMEEDGDSWLYGETELTVGANYPYSIDAHWLYPSFFAWFETEFDLGDFDFPCSTGFQTGQLGIAINVGIDGLLGDPETDDESGAVTWDEAQVMYPDDVSRGTVQVTLYAD